MHHYRFSVYGIRDYLECDAWDVWEALTRCRISKNDVALYYEDDELKIFD